MQNQASLQETKQHGAVRFPFNLYPCTIPGDFPAGGTPLAREHGAGLCQAGHRAGAGGRCDLPGLPGGYLSFCARARSTRCGRQRDSAWNTKISSLNRSCWAARRTFAPRSICCRCKAGGLSLPVRLTPNDLCYLQAAACLRELEDANRAKRPGYELLVKGALLRFLALLIAQGRQ